MYGGQFTKRGRELCLDRRGCLSSYRNFLPNSGTRVYKFSKETDSSEPLKRCHFPFDRLNRHNNHGDLGESCKGTTVIFFGFEWLVHKAVLVHSRSSIAEKMNE